MLPALPLGQHLMVGQPIHAAIEGDVPGPLMALRQFVLAEGVQQVQLRFEGG